MLHRLELLDAISKYQDAGFKRLYQWTVTTCAEVDGEPSSLLHRAIAILRDRAEFYKSDFVFIIVTPSVCRD